MFTFTNPSAMASAPGQITLLRGLDDEFASEPSMKFRLYYDGELKPTQRDPEDQQRDRLAPHKQQIRRDFHRQLRHLWMTNKFLSTYKRHPERDFSERPIGDPGAVFDYEDHQKIPLVDYIASNYRKLGYRFVPLVRDEASLLCSLNILFLRRDIPGSTLNAGDIDNRIKTLIDALRAPKKPNELIGNDQKPGLDDDPFYCLLWDDNQVSHFSGETDTLLDPPDGSDTDQRKVRLISRLNFDPMM